ncbi:MAG: pyruvate kinase, partial [Polyangia bacterium]
ETLRTASRETGLACRILFDLPGPKIRLRALTEGPAVLHFRRHKNERGETVGPCHVQLGGSHPGAIPIPSEWVRKLAVADEIRFRDTTKRKRTLKVVQLLSDHVLAECAQSFYLQSNTPIKWFRKNKKQAKARCGAVAAKPFSVDLQIGDRVLLIEGNTAPAQVTGAKAVFGISLPDLLASVSVHDRVVFDDGKLNGFVVEKIPSGVVVQVAQTQAETVALKDKKGVNFPDSLLPVRFVTPQDIQDLDAVINLADLIAFSFVRTAADVKEAIQMIHIRRKDLGIIIKLETQQGFRELPDLLLELLTHSPVGLMIARGDLAVECGFERLAELQEELLWLCEACHLPVIWATQVLENLTQTGIPTRAEITDAAMAMRAECVMLNRGPHIRDAVAALVNIIKKMEHHQYKKRQLFRPLHVADGQSAPHELVLAGSSHVP